MRRIRSFAALLVFAFLPTFLHAECTGDHDQRSNKASGLLITGFSISGTHTLSSEELARITSELTGSCFDENTEELTERIEALFKNRGYMETMVKNVYIRPNDPLAIPKPVSLEAEVVEGRRFKVAAIEFVGNHAFSTSKLRSEFSLKKGDLFARNKIGTGIEGVRDLYVSDGFIDWIASAGTAQRSDGSVALTLTVAEGPQYRMGKLEIFTKKELADTLRTDWELPEGAVFDLRYIDKYIDRNRSRLPAAFHRADVQIVRDCRDFSVVVRLPFDGTDPRSQSLPQDIDCKPPHGASQSSPEN